jgi:hypothetical protein
MRARLLVAIVLTALAALLVWRQRRDEAARARSRPVAGDTYRGLDPAGFRDHLASRRAAARALAERHARAAARARATRDVAPADPTPPPHRLAASMLAPTCILGPSDLCAAIADAIDACDRDDAKACLAVGQFLEDEPPRPLIVSSYYLYACKGGERAACARMKQLGKDAPVIACADDVMACAWRGYRTKDATVLDEACRFGVADACAYMLHETEADPVRSLRC